MRSLFLVAAVMLLQCAHAQRVLKVYRNPNDHTQNFYVLRLPEGKMKGLLVLNARTLADSANRKANALGVGILSVVPVSSQLDNLMSTGLLDTIDAMIGEVTRKYHIATDKIVIGGMSAAGTGAVRYAQYCAAKLSKQNIQPRGVFGVDPPLDYVRLYNEADRAIQRNFSQDAVEESKMLVKLLTDELKGTPQTSPQAYEKASPFCYAAQDGGNAALLNNFAVRLYTEPDITWWIENRRKDFYDLNCVDNAALINQLRINGNTKAELVVTHNKGLAKEGHPHSWSIVDENELLQWCDKLFHLQP
jgi:hypothetical protein